MNDGSGLGTLKSIGIDMAHDIVTYLPFPKHDCQHLSIIYEIEHKGNTK